MDRRCSTRYVTWHARASALVVAWRQPAWPQLIWAWGAAAGREGAADGAGVAAAGEVRVGAAGGEAAKVVGVVALGWEAVGVAAWGWEAAGGAEDVGEGAGAAAARAAASEVGA